MCSPSHFFIFPTTSHHDLAHNLHLFYVHPFSFFVISHHISSRSCTHFTFVLCAPLRIFLYFLLLLFLFCSCGCSCFSYKAPFFPSHRKARCLSRLLEYFQVKNLTFFNWSFTLCPSFFLCSIWPLDQDQDQDQDLKGGRIASQKGAGFIYRTFGLRKQVLAFRTLPRAHLAHSFWRFDFSRTLGGAPSRAQRYLQSPLGASKSNLGLRKQVFAFRTLPRAHLAHSFLRLDSSRILRGALPSVSLQKKARFAPPFCLHVKIKRASRSPPSASFKKEMVLRTSLCFNFFFKKALRAPSVFSLKGRALRALCLGPARPFPFFKKKKRASRLLFFLKKKRFARPLFFI